MGAFESAIWRIPNPLSFSTQDARVVGTVFDRKMLCFARAGRKKEQKSTSGFPCYKGKPEPQYCLPEEGIECGFSG